MTTWTALLVPTLAMVLVWAVMGVLVARSYDRRFREVERELTARYGKEQIEGLTAREVYVLVRAGALRPQEEK